MKSLCYSFLMGILFFGKIYSQDFSSHVASIPINDDRINDQIEKLNLPIIYLNEDKLITILTSEDRDIMKRLGVNYEILSEYEPVEKLYLIQSKQNVNVASKLAGEEIVYEDNNSVIVRNISVGMENILRLGMNANEIKLNNFFKNERRIVKNEMVLSDTLIPQITSSVNPENVRYYIQTLQDFETRFLLANTLDAVAEWIKNQFLLMGYTDVVIDSFQYQGTWQKNVIATLQGIYEPEVYNIVGGHHDSYSSGNPMVFAPGADDNASGTAAVLEIARVIKQNNYQPESTIKFITFGAEEYGLWGSYDYAHKAFLAGMNIKIMINHDMISHTYYPANQSELDINRYSGFEYLRDLAFNCIANYSVLSPVNGSLNSSGSDSYSFWELGFPAVYFEENNFSPYYHSPADTIGNYDMEYCAEVIKSSCATLLMSIGMPTMVENYVLVDAGTGNSLISMWNPNSSPDFDSYRVYVGMQSGIYDSVYTTTDTIFTIENLNEGNLYYVGVSVLDQDGYESLIVERSATPLLLPFAPKEFTAAPLWHQVELSWFENKEYDLLGYNIYRSDTEGELGEKLNQTVYQDTIYTDNTTVNGIYYYYTVKAVDSLLNESIENSTLRSRGVSLDQGILIVDETADGDGSPMNPTDQEVDDYYDDLLSHFNSNQYDLIEETQIGLADLGAYSTVVWHGNDFTDLSMPFISKEEIKKYLDFGGNFLYTGYRPSKAFENVIGLNGSFSSGDFIFDYLKIEQTKSTLFTLFNEGMSIASGYNSIFVDSSKSLVSDDYHLKNIEMIESSEQGINIFSFETNFDSTSPQGSLKGKPVGVEYTGNDFNTVTLSFPLYYMNKAQAKSLIEYILTNKFDEVMPVEGEVNEIPSSYGLFQNYPNPFNPSTTIKYSIADDGFVKLSVYNMLGEEIANLVNAQQRAGNYEVNFNAGNLASGVYVYRLETLNFTSSKKLILLR